MSESLFKTEALERFYEAFGRYTWGRSMGRAAEELLYTLDRFSEQERAVATEWLVQAFSEEWEYYSVSHIRMAVKMKDERFIPLLKKWYVRRRAGHHQRRQIEHEGEKVWIRTDYRFELRECRRAMRALRAAKLRKICRARRSEIRMLAWCPVILLATHLLIGALEVRIMQDTYSELIVPSYQFISYEQLRTCPPEISREDHTWFDDLVEQDVLNELRRYMRENDLYIRPGDYKLARVKDFEDLKSRLRFMTGDEVAAYFAKKGTT